MSCIPTFCPFGTASHYENIESPSFKMKTEFASRSTTHPSRSIIGHNSRKTLLELLHFLPKILQQTQKKEEQGGIMRCIFYQNEFIKVFQHWAYLHQRLFLMHLPS